MATVNHAIYTLQQSCQRFSSLFAAGGPGERFQRMSGEDADTENGDDKSNRPGHELRLN